MQIAIIRANPNSSELGEILSTHRTVKGAAKAMLKLDNARWTYAAERQADGSYPHRVAGLEMPAHEAVAAAMLDMQAR